VTARPVLSDADIADLTRRIHAERQRTVDRITQLRGAFEQITSAAAIAPPDDEHDPEGATVGFERAQITSLLAASRRHLEDLDEALATLGTAAAGRCRSCDQPIAIERLRARPAARTCVACADR
jgi:RNA polymerase-binding transcription factor DksA